jgi:hypothetical protein
MPRPQARLCFAIADRRSGDLAIAVHPIAVPFADDPITR